MARAHGRPTKRTAFHILQTAPRDVILPPQIARCNDQSSPAPAVGYQLVLLPADNLNERQPSLLADRSRLLGARSAATDRLCTSGRAASHLCSSPLQRKLVGPSSDPKPASHWCKVIC